MEYQKTAASIRAADSVITKAAYAYHDKLKKPPGSLGRIESLGIRLAGIAGRCPPPVPSRKAVLVFAADHGVAAQAVSAYPREATVQMVANVLQGGAAVSVLGRQVDARVVVVDAGVAGDLPEDSALVGGKVGPGTMDISAGPAMTSEQAVQALDLGVRVATREIERGLDMLACGEVGVGNTTPATAIVAVFTGRPPASFTGIGTGIDAEAVRRKAALIAEAIARNAPDRANGLDVLAKIGGFEIGAMAGAMLAGAAARIPVVLDGLISTSAALIAASIAPAAKDYFFAGHRSSEPSHTFALSHLGLEPLLILGMRLGEGTGAALAFGIIEAAARLMAEMATLEGARVSAARA